MQERRISIINEIMEEWEEATITGGEEGRPGGSRRRRHRDLGCGSKAMQLSGRCISLALPMVLWCWRYGVLCYGAGGVVVAVWCDLGVILCGDNLIEKMKRFCVVPFGNVCDIISLPFSLLVACEIDFGVA